METHHPQANLGEDQADLVTGGVRSRVVATLTLHPGLPATSVVHRREKKARRHRNANLISGERDEPQRPMALFWVLHLHPRGVGEATLALHNEEGDRPQGRERGERVVLTLRPRGDTVVAEAHLLLRDSGDEALMRDEDRKVLNISERMISQLLLLPQSN